jgi:hypothetical protein
VLLGQPQLLHLLQGHLLLLLLLLLPQVLLPRYHPQLLLQGLLARCLLLTRVRKREPM